MLQSNQAGRGMKRSHWVCRVEGSWCHSPELCHWGDGGRQQTAVSGPVSGRGGSEYSVGRPLFKGTDSERNARARMAGNYLGWKNRESLSPAYIGIWKCKQTDQPVLHIHAHRLPRPLHQPPTFPLGYLPNEWSHSIWSIHPYLHIGTPVIWAIGITWGRVVGDSWILRRENIQWRTSL